VQRSPTTCTTAEIRNRHAARVLPSTRTAADSRRCGGSVCLSRGIWNEELRVGPAQSRARRRALGRRVRRSCAKRQRVAQAGARPLSDGRARRSRSSIIASRPGCSPTETTTRPWALAAGSTWEAAEPEDGPGATSRCCSRADRAGAAAFEATVAPRTVPRPAAQLRPLWPGLAGPPQSHDTSGQIMCSRTRPAPPPPTPPRPLDERRANLAGVPARRGQRRGRSCRCRTRDAYACHGASKAPPRLDQSAPSSIARWRPPHLGRPPPRTPAATPRPCRSLRRRAAARRR